MDRVVRVKERWRGTGKDEEGHGDVGKAWKG